MQSSCTSPSRRRSFSVARFVGCRMIMRRTPLATCTFWARVASMSIQPSTASILPRRSSNSDSHNHYEETIYGVGGAALGTATMWRSDALHRHSLHGLRAHLFWWVRRDLMPLPELRRAGAYRLLFLLARFAHYGEHLALDLRRQFSDTLQISRFHQICRLYRCDGQCLPTLINRHSTGQSN